MVGDGPGRVWGASVIRKNTISWKQAGGATVKQWPSTSRRAGLEEMGDDESMSGGELASNRNKLITWQVYAKTSGWEMQPLNPEPFADVP
jgi:hypothetical protein